MQEYLKGSHNTRFQIDTLALQALLADSRDEQLEALVVLENSLRLAQAGGFIRVFLDLGAQIADLLSQMKVDKELKAYVKQILTAIPEPKGTVSSISQGEFLELLTNREFQILELLGERLTNKEIAKKLIISPGTVKGHTIKIYQKLEVNGRRQAVERAYKLGILEP